MYLAHPTEKYSSRGQTSYDLKSLVNEFPEQEKD
jgi:hypothetical protein